MRPRLATNKPRSKHRTYRLQAKHQVRQAGHHDHQPRAGLVMHQGGQLLPRLLLRLDPVLLVRQYSPPRVCIPVPTREPEAMAPRDGLVGSRLDRGYRVGRVCLCLGGIGSVLLCESIIVAQQGGSRVWNLAFIGLGVTEGY